jgi:hypothetical protein
MTLQGTLNNSDREPNSMDINLITSKSVSLEEKDTGMH